MFIMELTDKRTGKVVMEVSNTVYESKRTAIRLAAYAGWLRFERERGGDLHAENSNYVINIMAA